MWCPLTGETVYVLWSGGLDSTYLIYKLLSESEKTRVIAGYSEILNNEHKTKAERRATSKLAKLFTREFGDRFQFREHTAKMQITWENPNISLVQIPMWIFSAAMTCPADADKVAVGYVMNDCAISYLKEIQDAFAGFSPLFDEPLPPIVFPLMKESKERFVDKLPLSYKENVWWCENPVIKGRSIRQCGYNCAPCKRSPLRFDLAIKEATKNG